MVIKSFLRKSQQQSPSASQQYQYPRGQPDYADYTSHAYPLPQPTKDERHLDFLLNPSIPENRPHLEKHWTLASDAARHLQLTNIPDVWTFRMLQRLVSDLFRIATWDCPTYFEERHLKFYSMIMMLKSVGYTRNDRERDALNATRETRVMRDDRSQIPRESPGFMQGMLMR